MTLNVLQLLFCIELCRNVNFLDVVCVFDAFLALLGLVFVCK